MTLQLVAFQIYTDASYTKKYPGGEQSPFTDLGADWAEQGHSCGKGQSAKVHPLGGVSVSQKSRRNLSEDVTQEEGAVQ